MNIEDIPAYALEANPNLTPAHWQWAKEEACRRANALIEWDCWKPEMVGGHCGGSITALALMIAKHEQPPVDPEVEEAIKDAVAYLHATWVLANRPSEKLLIVDAIRRGMKIERERGK